VERRRHRERCELRIDSRLRHAQVFRASGDHDLLGRVVVRDIDDEAVDRRLDRRQIQRRARHRRHAAFSDRHRALHQPPALRTIRSA
jgi:hypothetical protein